MMGGKMKRPSSALPRARWAGTDMQAGAALHPGTYAFQHEMQVARLVRRYGLSRHRAELLVPLVYGEGR